MDLTILRPVAGILAREQRLLLLFLAVVGLGGAFGALASEMLEGETVAFDRAITHVFRVAPQFVEPIGSPWLPHAVIDITALGSVSILTLVTVLVFVFLLLSKRPHQALLVAGAIAGGALLSWVLKAIFARPRPEIVPHLVEVSSLSFPSGHATNSAIVYLTLAMLLSRAYTERATRLFILGAAIFLTMIVGISRIYLGVHYPSDVAAGWMAGGCWALAMSALARVLQQRRQIEQPETTKKRAG